MTVGALEICKVRRGDDDGVLGVAPERCNKDRLPSVPDGGEPRVHFGDVLERAAKLHLSSTSP
jgi:hypothetical protein